MERYLGIAWGNLGDHVKKRYMLTEALQITEKHYGKAHPQHGRILMNLGKVFGSLRNFKRQKELLTEALQIFEKNYPPDHSYIIELRQILQS